MEDKKIITFLGKCFSKAEFNERVANVDVVLIRLHKPEIDTKSRFEGMKFDIDDEINTDSFSANTLASNDVIKNLVARYNVARSVLIQRHESESKLEFYLDGISDAICESVQKGKNKTLIDSIDINQQLMILKSRFWNTVFEKTKLGTRTTSDFQKTFKEFAISQSAMAFNEHNVKELIYMFFFNRENIMKDAVVQVFDFATGYHEKNRIHSEGWKTNKSYRLNKRIIIPDGVLYEDNKFKPYPRIDVFLNDIDKVLSWLSGVRFEEGVRTYWDLDGFCFNCSRYNLDYTRPFTTRFFRVKIFKKGTLHLDFLDLDLLNTFNKVAAEGKNWIGGGY